MSVGLLVVHLLNRFYVCVHLSKWFTFFAFLVVRLLLLAGNQRVPGVVVPSLAAGLELVGQGDVASLVGRLNPGFRVVDVDVEGLVGHAVAEEVAGWCRGRRL